MIVAVLLDRRRNEVRKRSGTIRQRIERSDSAPDRIDESIGNTTIGEWLAGERIGRNTEETLRKVTVALSHCRHVRHARDSFARARALVVGKEKGLVVADWTAERETKLIADVFGRRFVGGREEILRVQRAVAMKLKNATVKVVGA